MPYNALNYRRIVIRENKLKEIISSLLVESTAKEKIANFIELEVEPLFKDDPAWAEEKRQWSTVIANLKQSLEKNELVYHALQLLLAKMKRANPNMRAGYLTNDSNLIIRAHKSIETIKARSDEHINSLMDFHNLETIEKAIKNYLDVNPAGFDVKMPDPIKVLKGSKKWHIYLPMNPGESCAIAGMGDSEIVWCTARKINNMFYSYASHPTWLYYVVNANDLPSSAIEKYSIGVKAGDDGLEIIPSTASNETVDSRNRAFNFDAAFGGDKSRILGFIEEHANSLDHDMHPAIKDVEEATASLAKWKAFMKPQSTELRHLLDILEVLMMMPPGKAHSSVPHDLITEIMKQYPKNTDEGLAESMEFKMENYARKHGLSPNTLDVIAGTISKIPSEIEKQKFADWTSSIRRTSDATAIYKSGATTNEEIWDEQKTLMDKNPVVFLGLAEKLISLHRESNNPNVMMKLMMKLIERYDDIGLKKEINSRIKWLLDFYGHAIKNEQIQKLRDLSADQSESLDVNPLNRADMARLVLNMVEEKPRGHEANKRLKEALAALQDIGEDHGSKFKSWLKQYSPAFLVYPSNFNKSLIDEDLQKQIFESLSPLQKLVLSLSDNDRDLAVPWDPQRYSNSRHLIKTDNTLGPMAMKMAEEDLRNDLEPVRFLSTSETPSPAAAESLRKMIPKMLNLARKTMADFARAVLSFNPREANKVPNDHLDPASVKSLGNMSANFLVRALRAQKEHLRQGRQDGKETVEAFGRMIEMPKPRWKIELHEILHSVLLDLEIELEGAISSKRVFPSSASERMGEGRKTRRKIRLTEGQLRGLVGIISEAPQITVGQIRQALDYVVQVQTGKADKEAKQKTLELFKDMALDASGINLLMNIAGKIKDVRQLYANAANSAAIPSELKRSHPFWDAITLNPRQGESARCKGGRGVHQVACKPHKRAPG